MLDVFGQVKSLVKLDDICIDNNVFRLHYKVTGVILVMATLLVTSRQYIGDPIDCLVEEIPPDVRDNLKLLVTSYILSSDTIHAFIEHEKYKKLGIDDKSQCVIFLFKVMDTYCWIHSTFSVPGHEVGISGDVVYPGVAQPSNSQDDGQQLRYHKYYQWICFTLFFQAILFYVPRYLWKTWENGRIKMLVQEMNVPILDQETKKDRIRLIIDYFTGNRMNHQLYTLKFFFCEGILQKYRIRMDFSIIIHINFN